MSDVASVRVRSYSAAERWLDTSVNIGGTLGALLGAVVAALECVAVR